MTERENFNSDDHARRKFWLPKGLRAVTNR